MISHRILSHAFFICTLLIIALPLLSLPPLFSPPDWGKTLVFRVIFSLEILIGAAILLFYPSSLRTIPWKKKGGLGFWMLCGILGFFLLATVFSFNHSFSVWGSPFRAGGVVNFASYILSAILAFLVLKPKEWNIVWNFALGIAALISIIAFFQWRGLFSDIFVKMEGRPASSLGNPILLAMYLLFFVFLALSSGFKERAPLKKILYFSLVLLFIFVIIITQSRSSYLGLAVAFSFFVLLYPFKKPWQGRIMKGLFLFFTTIIITIVYLINTTGLDDFPKFIQENHTLFGIVKRMDVSFFLEDPRFSSWQVAVNAVKERPLVGYGPENFEIGFDREYDPKLPGIQLIQGTANSWWDRAHNIFLDIATQAGIPAALLMVALVILLILQLQRIKKDRSEQTLLIHGIQAAFVGYLTTDFFSFDTFSTFLLFFFLAAYSLALINETKTEREPAQEEKRLQESAMQKKLALSCLALFLVWFSWSYAVRPLQINGNLNLGIVFAKAQQCEQGMKFLDKAVLESKNTFLNAYTRLKYFDTLKECNDQGSISNAETAQKGYDVLKEAAITWPNHTRTWIFLGQLTNILLEQQEKAGALSLEQKEAAVSEANSYFETAKQLSPGHLEVYIDWTKTFLLAQDYRGAAAKAQECIDLNEETGECWFLKGAVELFADNSKQGFQYIEIAKTKGFYHERSIPSLTLLAQAFITSQDMGNLAKTYETMVSLQPENYQLRASLAFTYYQLREFAKAKEQALKVLEINPASKAEVEEFLKLLP